MVGNPKRGKKGEAVDVITVRGELEAKGKLDQAGGEDYLLQLTNTIPTITSAESYTRRIAELAQLRQMIGTCQDLAVEGYNSAGEVSEHLDRAELSKLPIDIDDSAALTLLSLRGKCRRARTRRNGLDLAVVDYLQLLRAGGRYGSRSRRVDQLRIDFHVIFSIADLKRG